MARTLFLLGAVALLSGCMGSGTPVETKWKTVTVTVRGPCPEEAVYNQIVAEKPKPLREQPMPPTAVERNAKTSAQLGSFEATGGWADKVMSVLARCQATGEVSRVKSAP